MDDCRDQQIVLVPVMFASKPLFQLMVEQNRQHGCRVQKLVDADCIIFVALQHPPASDPVRCSAYVCREFLDIVGGGHAIQPDAHRQRVVRGMHSGELGAAELLAVAPLDEFAGKIYDRWRRVLSRWVLSSSLGLHH